MSEDDNDWVAHLLAATDTPPMPADVAERLERTIHGHIESTTGPAVGEVTGSAAAAAAAAVPAAPAGVPGQDSTDGGPDASAADPTAADRTRADDAAPGQDAPGQDAPVEPVPPPVSPALGGMPVAGGLPVAAGVDDLAARRAEQVDGADRAGASPDETTGPTPVVGGRSGRSWGGSRRERREEDLGERRRQLLTRWVPVAAGVLVLGAAGVTAVNLTTGGGDDASLDASTASGGAEAVAAPRELVATGTEYSTTDVEAFTEQVRGLVALTSGGDTELQADEAAEAGADDGAEAPAAPEEESAAAASVAEAGDVSGSPLSDPEEFARCLDEVTAGGVDTATAVDLAVVDGVESTVVVVPDPTGESFFVYVVGPDCSADTRFDFFTITP